MDRLAALTGVDSLSLLRGDVSRENLNRKSARPRDKCPTKIGDVSRLIYSHEFFFLGRRGLSFKLPAICLSKRQNSPIPPNRENLLVIDFASISCGIYDYGSVLSVFEILDDFFFIDYLRVLSNVCNSGGRV